MFDVLHLPYDSANAYHIELLEALRAEGIAIQTRKGAPHWLPTEVAARRVQAVHLHWLNHFFLSRTTMMTTLRLCRFIAGLWMLRRRGIGIFYTVHNLVNHEHEHVRLDRLCGALVARLADGIFVHAETTRREVVRHYRLGPAAAAAVTVIHHGHVIDCYPNTVSRAEARAALGLPDTATVLLCLGQIRAYKGVVELIEAFRAAAGATGEAHLVIAGRAADAMARDLRAAAAGCDRIHLAVGFVEPAEIQVYMNAADLCVLPYRDITTSGALLLAMSFGRGCVAPRMAYFEEILGSEGGMLYDPRAPGALAQALRAAIARRGEHAAWGRRNLERARQWTWTEAARRTANVYRHGQSRGGR